MASHQKLLVLDFDLFVAGHLYRFGTRSDVEQSLRYVQDVVLAADNALKSVPEAEAVRIASQAREANSPAYGNAWYVVGQFLKVLEDKCYRSILAKYGCQLASVDVTVRTACVRAVEFVRLSR
jgi:hypothetical protein